MSVDELIADGLASLREGDHGKARELLGRAVRLNPQAERAWLALASACDEQAHRRYCLERCLALNPANEAARAALAEVPATHQREGATPSAAPHPQQEAPASGAPARAETPLAARLVAGAKGRTAQHGSEPDIQTDTQPAISPEATETAAGQQRVRRLSEPPLLLHPVALSESGPPALPTVEEVAEAALHHLLHHGASEETQDQRPSDAATIARRYFGAPRPAPQPQTPRGALQALGMQRTGVRPVRLMSLLSALLAVSVLLALLFTALLTV
jgi:hypothetical protein